MGATQSSTSLPERELPRLEERLPSVLPNYRIEAPLVSGRFMKTFCLRHNDSSCVVLKTAWLVLDETTAKHHESYQDELRRLKQVLQTSPSSHVAPFTHWFYPNNHHSNNNNNNNANTSAVVRNGVSWIPVYLVRPHFYTTVSDRLASRPWLQPAEKLFLTRQFLTALDHLHRNHIVHGCLTTQNMALTGTGWLVLTDLASAVKPWTRLPDDDPSEFVYYFQRTAERRCYLAPERFVGAATQTALASTAADTTAEQQQHDQNQSPEHQPPLTPAMDIFSAGCCLAELFLNGEPTLSLGELLEVRKHGESTPALQQHLAKLERPAIRAAVKHMLALNGRLTAGQYLERLAQAEPFSESFQYLDQLLEQVTVTTLTPDARIGLAARAYRRVLWETVGVRDDEMQTYLDAVLGNEEANVPKEKPRGEEENARDLFAETQALLQQLESLHVDDGTDEKKNAEEVSETAENTEESPSLGPQREERSEQSKGSLLIYLQMITATIRHVQRPASKLVALQLLRRLAKHSTDEARLQRIVPVTISLLQDQDSLVRASAVQVLTYTVSIIQSFPPSDAQIFPQYIFKRVAHLITDPSLVARLAFARSLAVLVETALRFLDITHAVRLYEAVGSGTQSVATSEKEEPPTVFGDDVHRLLDTAVSRSSSRLSLSEATDTSDKTSGRAMIKSTYTTELASLQEIISRWVVQLTTDQSSHSSFSKRAVLQDLGRLCSFFGLDGVMTFILPQILAFLNERKDWELRAAMLEQLPAVCSIIGRAATEEFVLPCVEIGLVDAKEYVISRALHCLSAIVQLGLLSRVSIMGSPADEKTGNNSLLAKYGILLLHPSEDVRSSAIDAMIAMCQKIGLVDVQVHVIPLLSSLFRFQPTAHDLMTAQSLMDCLHFPWSREKYVHELESVASSTRGLSQAMGAWTSVGIAVSDETTTTPVRAKPESRRESQDIREVDPQASLFREFLVLLLRHTAASSVPQERGPSDPVNSELFHGIEGSAKLAQSIMFPRQNGRGQRGVVPSWYISLRDEVEAKNLPVSAEASIRSVSSLGSVFGLSIMGPASGASDSVVDASEGAEGATVSTKDVLHTKESKNIEAAFAGRWGAETTVDPELVDTSLLVTKLKAMRVPPLPPQLGGTIPQLHPTRLMGRDGSSAKNWKPKMNALMATSATSNGHTSPVMRLAVSGDQRFFASASHDGTCRVWEIPQIEDSPGILESSACYTGHSDDGPARINDLAMLEGSHSVVSGASDGSVHVWRVDMLAPSSKSGAQQQQKAEMSKVVGTSCIRRVHPQEGEIMGVSHFNSASASVITFATQKGVVHSWDLRSAQEPFSLKHSPSLGYLSALALGSDRNWLVTGTNRGYLSLWDIRFAKPVKLWHHSRGSPISRLATSYVQSPHDWGSTDTSAVARPFVFVASGSNECGMFDVLNGSCQGCFRAVERNSRNVRGHIEEPPSLHSVRMTGSPGICKEKSPHTGPWPLTSFSSASVNCMVGSIGAGDQSYLITGGSDGLIRFWDFALPSKCYVVSGQASAQNRPSYERIDFDRNRRLMLCRQTKSLGSLDSATMPRKLFRGLKKPEHYHCDAVQDLKIIDNNCLISCSRDCTVKVWR